MSGFRGTGRSPESNAQTPVVDSLSSEAISFVIRILPRMFESAASAITTLALTDADSLRAGENAPDSPSSYSFLRVPHYI